MSPLGTHGRRVGPRDARRKTRPRADPQGGSGNEGRVEAQIRTGIAKYEARGGSDFTP